MERAAEPASALFRPPDDQPTRLLELAWRDLVLNSAHDSACACSTDDVVDGVLARYTEARELGTGLAREAVSALAASIDAPPGAVVVANPGAHDRTGVIELTLPHAGRGSVLLRVDDGEPLLTQTLADVVRDVLDTTVVGEKVAWVLELIDGAEIAGVPIGRVDRATRDDGSLALHFVGAAGPDDATDLGSLRAELRELGAHGRDLPRAA